MEIGKTPYVRKQAEKGIMTRTSIVQDYKHPNPGSTSTLTIDDRIQQEILKNNIKKPKGYTVSYHANPETEKMHFGSNHPMKPWRLTLTNKIVMAYGMHEAMDIYIPRAATEEELKNFHHADYIDFLQRYGRCSSFLPRNLILWQGCSSRPASAWVY